MDLQSAAGGTVVFIVEASKKRDGGETAWKIELIIGMN